LASARYPIGELTFFRSFFAVIPVFVWVGYRGELPSVFYTRHIGQHLIRSVAGASAMFCGFSALSLLPIADATAIGYAAPLLTVVFAVFLLGEKVHIYRWSAVFVGLFGVLVILSDYVVPGASGAGERSISGAAFAVGGAVFGALAATQVRSLVRYESAATIVIYFSLFTALFSLGTIPFGWVVPT
ncbi:MAG: DMT family transporter, partial [Rhodobacteraceae bacterium]|nr:DMT family transporter [Paracoccaceae bacterium]